MPGGPGTTNDENMVETMGDMAYCLSTKQLSVHQRFRRMLMPPRKNTTVLSVMHEVCCGLDVHKESISACLITADSDGEEIYEMEVFGTFTDDLLRLRDWLLHHKCPIVALESTGIYWRPVHNILEAHLDVVLANARHIKNLPGRKTDLSDCQWIAGLLRVGLIRGSFIPPKEARQWRDLTRYRRSLVRRLGDAQRQAHKLLESGNIKIDSVASELFGRTGRNLMALLLKDKEELTQSHVDNCVKGKLKPKAPELFRAIQGFFQEHHRWLLADILDRVRDLEERVARVEARLRDMIRPHEELIERLDAMPGISYVAAHAIVSEVGTTLDTFVNAAALCSWAGVSPGNNQSAGKRHNARSPVRSSHLRSMLIEVAWAAIKTKHSYYRVKYFSLKSRLGPKKAIVAIAHRLLKAIFHVIKHGAVFKDLGEDYLTDLNRSSKVSYLMRQAKKMGFKLVPVSL
jgi:transposase